MIGTLDQELDERPVEPLGGVSASGFLRRVIQGSIALALNHHPKGLNPLENLTRYNRRTFAFYPTRTPGFPFVKSCKTLFIIGKLPGNGPCLFVWHILDREYLRFCFKEVPVRLEPGIEDRRWLWALRKLCTLDRAERQKMLKNAATLRQQLRDARFSEIDEIVLGGEGTSPIEAAKRIKTDADTDSWIPGPLQPGVLCPLSNDEVFQLYASQGAISSEEEVQLSIQQPAVEWLGEYSPVAGDYGELTRVQSAASGRLAEIVEAQAALIKQKELASALQEQRSFLSRFPNSDAASVLIEAQDFWRADNYEEACHELYRLEGLREVFKNRKESLAKLDLPACAWALAIANRQKPHDCTKPPGSEPASAWRWRSWLQELKRRAAVSIPDLQERLNATENELRRLAVSWTNPTLPRSASSGQWSHIDHAAVLSRGGTQRQRFVIQARLVGQDARDKS
jgi:hypothetical protein